MTQTVSLMVMKFQVEPIRLTSDSDDDGINDGDEFQVGLTHWIMDSDDDGITNDGDELTGDGTDPVD